MAPPKQPLSETKASLERIQQFDAEKLSRKDDFGNQLNFSSTVEPAKRLIELFRRLSVDALDDFPVDQLNNLRSQTDNAFNLFDQILKFKGDEGNIAQVRQQLTDQITSAYPGAFGTLLPFIGYAAARAADFQRLEAQGRAAVQSISDRADEMMAGLNKTKEEAEATLNAAQRAALEQGVSQQSIYFKEEAERHDTAATTWQKYTIIMAIIVSVYAAVTVFLHKWTFLKPSTTFESAQLITSKILIFAVLSYLLILSARNFLSHKHNSIVNKHRQNALMTFNALASAAKDQNAKDIILTHAASCIFAPQETGYAKSSTSGDPAITRSIMGLISKSDGGSTSGAHG
jgi:hypothetical protein